MNELPSLRDFSVLITGASSGIGRQLARELFWEERCNLLLLDQDSSGLETLKDELCGGAPAHPSVEIYVCDISSSSSVEAFLAELGRKKVDVLVNNAGLLHVGLFEKMEPQDFERVVNTNILGTLRVTRALLPRLLESHRPFIVNVASMAGLIGAPGLCAYAASKFAIVGFSQALAHELKGRAGVCVVCPTLVKTDLAANALPGREGSAEERARRAELMKAVLSAMGANPSKVCRAVIRSIKSRKRLVLINPDAHLLYYLNRFFPAFSDFFISKAYEKIRKMGLME